jgi:hypothetical protein
MSVDPIWTGLFPDDVIPRIIQLVQRCAKGLGKRAACESENSLSDRLYHRIVRDPVYRDALTIPAELYRELSVYHGSVPNNDADIEEDTEPSRPGPIGRVDFVFKNGGAQKPYPEFVIEAKRLNVTFPRAGHRSLVPEYVTGDQGMMCFITGRYSPAQNSGAMLGYVFDGDITSARSEISAAIARNAATLCIRNGTAFEPTNHQGFHGDQTEHALKDRKLRLYHLLIRV